MLPFFTPSLGFYTQNSLLKIPLPPNSILGLFFRDVSPLKQIPRPQNPWFGFNLPDFGPFSLAEPFSSDPLPQTLTSFTSLPSAVSTYRIPPWPLNFLHSHNPVKLECKMLTKLFQLVYKLFLGSTCCNTPTLRNCLISLASHASHLTSKTPFYNQLCSEHLPLWQPGPDCPPRPRGWVYMDPKLAIF